MPALTKQSEIYLRMHTNCSKNDIPIQYEVLLISVTTIKEGFLQRMKQVKINALPRYNRIQYILCLSDWFLSVIKIF